MSSSSPLKLLDDSYESQLICSLYLDICSRDEEMQELESLLVQQSIASGSILKDDFQAPTFTNARIAAKLNGHLDLFESCCDAQNIKISAKEGKILSYRPFGTRQTIDEVSNIHQYSKPQSDVRVVTSKQKENDSHVIPQNPSKRKELDSVEKRNYSKKRRRSNAIEDRAGQKKGNLPKLSPTEDRLDFYEKVLELKKYKEKYGHMNINTDNQEFRSLVNFCHRNRFHYRHHLRGAIVMPKYKIDLLNEIGFDWENIDEHGPKTLTTPIGTLVKNGNSYVLF
ncbi:hypothetical protein CTEN210_15808 [Chaetoceros tenuissimus]|uniref:Helicase-associated domain-containing protein n=1 Tax=Chaetoceros tenuissimus TaxID=426638 RepID=A0AAD3D8E8_9STRA|nr:hypothetical protein CTEN210_15808 [Chaetoceros tenuissimus]